jgi:H+-transporting ATPase
VAEEQEQKEKQSTDQTDGSEPTESQRVDMSLEELKTELNTSLDGLSREEAERRLDEYGPNKLPEEKAHPVVQFLSYFWGPIPWMIEAAAVLSAAVGHWTDFIVIMVLLAFNGVVGFWEEHQAENAVQALKEQLAVGARVSRRVFAAFRMASRGGVP